MRTRTADRLKSLLHNHAQKIPQSAWNRMAAAERVEALMGQSLDNCRAILDLPIEMAITSPTVMTGKTQVVRALLQTTTKIGLENSRLRAMQDDVLGQLIDDFDREEGLSSQAGTRIETNGKAR